MAVVLTAAPRVNPAPCNHFTATIVVDGGRTVQVVITPADLQGAIPDDDVVAVLKAWARYHTSRGKTLPSLIGQTIFAEIP